MSVFRPLVLLSFNARRVLPPLSRRVAVPVKKRLVSHGAPKPSSVMDDWNGESRSGGFVDSSLKPAPKRIVVCCDGTWQSSVSNSTNIPSNVTRLARYLMKVGKDDRDQQWQQLVYYDAGIGTGVGDVEAKFQGGTGSGFITNVIEAYNFIVLNYNPGDQIFCLGFSRGAYTARAVAGVVTDIGIIRPRDMQDFPELYHIYQSNTDSHEFRKSAAWREWIEGKRVFSTKQKDISDAWKKSPSQWEKRPHHPAPESSRWVEAVGVFDTVGSLGIPKIPGVKGMIANFFGKQLPVEEFGFHNVALSPYIKNAYHAMALDEHRGPFSPTLWHYPADGVAEIPQPRASSGQIKKECDALSQQNKPIPDKLWGELVDAEMYEELKGAKSRLVQVWFPGVHINVGGGSNDLLKEKISDYEQIAMITLTWMVEQLKRHLNFEVNFAELSNTDRFMLMRPVVDELITQGNDTNWLMKRVNDIIAKDPKNDPWQDGNQTRTLLVAADALRGWATGPIIDSFTGAMVAAGSIDRTPGEYKETKLQDGTTVKLGRTNESIHPTVKFRMDQVKDYRPVALKGFKRQQTKDTNQVVSYEWTKGNVRIPEWKIGGMDSHERACVVSATARDHLGRLDRDLGVDSWEARDLNKKPEVDPVQTGFQPSKL